MSGTLGMAATRMNLLRSQKRLLRVEKGIDLMRRKREALVTELFSLARPAVDARALIGNLAAGAYPLLYRALAQQGYVECQAIGWPSRDLAWRSVRVMVWGHLPSPTSPAVRPLAQRRWSGSSHTPRQRECGDGGKRQAVRRSSPDLLLDACSAGDAHPAAWGRRLAQTSRQGGQP